jgi:hypothetical protein
MIVNAPPLLAMTWFNARYQARLQLLQRMASLKSWDFDREFGLSTVLTGLEKAARKR